MLNKKHLSIAIVVLAIAVIAINLWKTLQQNEQVKAHRNSNQANHPPTEKELVVDLTAVEVGKPAPDFEARHLHGKSVKLSDYRGKTVILNLWATWCPPCRAEMPHMQTFYEKNKSNGVEIVAVNLTTIDHGEAAIRQFVQDFGLSFDILLDEDGSVVMKYPSLTIPTSFLIDSKGIVREKIMGPMDEEKMSSLIKSIQ